MLVKAGCFALFAVAVFGGSAASAADCRVAVDFAFTDAYLSSVAAARGAGDLAREQRRCAAAGRAAGDASYILPILL